MDTSIESIETQNRNGELKGKQQQVFSCFSIYLNTLYINTKFGTDLGNYDRIDNLFSEFKNIDFQLHNKRNAAE